MNLGTLLVLIGVIVAAVWLLVRARPERRGFAWVYLLGIAILLIGIGVLCGARQLGVSH
jgi:hypothetical membrane protein